MHQLPLTFRKKTLALVIAIGLVTAACGSKDNAETLLGKAKVHLDHKEQSAAVIELKNALQKNPDLGEARFLLGKTLLEQGDAKSAEAELRRAQVLKYDNNQTLPQLARSLLDQDEGDKVLLEFEGTKLQTPAAQAEFLSVLGSAYLATAKPDKATSTFIEAEAVQPGYAPAILGEARVLASKKDFDGAAAKIESVLAQTPKYVPALTLKGDLNRYQTRLDAAAAAYEQALAIEPKNFTTRVNLTSIYLNQQKFDAVKTQVEELRKLAPKNPVVNYFDALLAFRDKQYAKAKDAIQQSLALAPNNIEALLLAGMIEQQLGQPAQSEQHLKTVLDKMPNNLLARKQLATLYIKEKQSIKADEILQPALARMPNDPGLLTLAGDAALAKGELTQASKFYAQATQLNPKNSRALTQNAVIELAQGDHDRALAMLETAAASDSTDANPDVTLVLAYLQRKEYDQALKAWQNLEKKDGKNPLTYNLQAAILLGKKDEAGARRALEQALKIQPTYFAAAANLAQLDLQAKQPEAAKQRYRSVLEKDSNNPEALLALADLERSTGASNETVLKLLNQAHAGNPDAAQPVVALVRFYLAAGDDQQAANTIQQALLAAPKNPQLLETSAYVQSRIGASNKAVQSYAQLVKDHPKNVLMLLQLAEAQAASGDVDAALASVDKALTMQAGSVQVQNAAITIALQNGKLDAAQKLLDRIRKTDPKAPALPQFEGDVRMASADYAGAVAAYKQAYALSPGNSLVIKLHQALMSNNNAAEANKVLNDWLTAHPDDTGVQIYAADTALGNKDFVKAASLYQTILKRQPNNVVALNNLAWASLQTKDGKAMEYAQKAADLAPANPAVMDTYGWILVEQGDAKKGIEVLRKASGSAPLQWDIKLHLAKGLIKTGQKDAAREQLRAIIKAAADSASGKEASQVLASI